MTKPQSALAFMLTFVLVLGGLAFHLHEGLARAFHANPVLNTIILVILFVGILAAFRQIMRVDRAVVWIQRFRQHKELKGDHPLLLVPLVPLLQPGRGVAPVSATSLRAMLDGIFARLDDSRDFSRYLMNVLILLGLLGTFWGLLQTAGGIGSVIGGLSIGEGDIKQVFEHFKVGLQKPLDGMGISFSASLFGLASSLIVGFLDLQAGHAQNQFCAELEEWLSRSAVLEPAGSGAQEGAAPAPARYQAAMIQNLAEQLEEMQKTLRIQEETRGIERNTLRALHERIASVDDHLQSHNRVLEKLSELQQTTVPLLAKLADSTGGAAAQNIAVHARSIDLGLKEASSRMSSAAENLATELRSELKIIAKILAQKEPGNGERSES